MVKPKTMDDMCNKTSDKISPQTLKHQWVKTNQQKPWTFTVSVYMWKNEERTDGHSTDLRIVAPPR